MNDPEIYILDPQKPEDFNSVVLGVSMFYEQFDKRPASIKWCQSLANAESPARSVQIHVGSKIISSAFFHGTNLPRCAIEETHAFFTFAVTDPEFQRQGHMQTVLERIIAESKHLGFLGLYGGSIDKGVTKYWLKRGFEQYEDQFTNLVMTF